MHHSAIAFFMKVGGVESDKCKNQALFLLPYRGSWLQNTLKMPEDEQSMCVLKLLQLCLTLCDPMDYSPPGTSVRGILQARILKCWNQRIFLTQELNPHLLHLLHFRQILYPLNHLGSPKMNREEGKSCFLKKELWIIRILCSE